LIDHLILRHRQNQAHLSDASFLPAMYGTLEWLVCQAESNVRIRPQIFRCHYRYLHARMPLGAGRFYTKEFLDLTDALLFESDRDRLLDDRGYHEVTARGLPVEYFTIADGPILSIKGPWSQLNPLEAFFKSQSIGIEEYSFEAFGELRRALSGNTLRRLVGPEAPAVAGLPFGFADSISQT
jgi:hypothetical protein